MFEQVVGLLSGKFLIPFVVLILAKYIPNEILHTFFLSLGKGVSAAANKIPVFNVLWEKVVEPWIINGLNVSVNALTEGLLHDTPEPVEFPLPKES